MGIKLALEKRYNGNNIVLALDELVELFNRDDVDTAKNELYQGLAPMAAMQNGYVHDRIQLAIIANWVRGGGSSLVGMKDWLRLARKINHIKDDDTELNLSRAQADLIYERLKSEEFRIQRADPAFIEFVIHFLEAAGYADEFLGEDDDDNID